MRAHTAIVGGGIMGTAVAMHLAERLHPIEEPVVLFERKRLGAGSSGRSAAILRQHYAARDLAAMARDSLRVWAGFEAATGYSVGFQRTGVVVLARSEAARERLRANVEMLREVGIETELVEGAALKKRVPGIELAPDDLGAWEPEGGFVDPERALAAFASVARYRGTTTRADCAVRELEVEDGRLRALVTDDDRVECVQAVLCAGAWTRALLARAGVDLPLEVVAPRQQLLAMPKPPPSARVPDPVELAPPGVPLVDTALRPVNDHEALPAAHPVVLDLEHGFAARCQPNLGRTRIAALDLAAMPRLVDPDALDESRDEPFATWARDTSSRRLPAYRDAEDHGQIAGWYTLTPDDRPLIGPVPGIEGLWIVAGFNGHGFKLAPSIGEGVARMLVGEPAGTFDVEPMGAGRFFLSGSHEERAPFGF